MADIFAVSAIPYFFVCLKTLKNPEGCFKTTHYDEKRSNKKHGNECFRFGAWLACPGKHS